MISRIFLLLGIASLAPFITACEGHTDYYREVTNQTNEAITVYAASEFEPDIIVEVNPGETQPILATDQLGGNYFIINPSERFDYFYILNSSGDTCKKDHTNQQVWDVFVNKIRKAPSTVEQTYTLRVFPEDF